MKNPSVAFGNSSLGELYILHIQKYWEMFFRGIVKKYTLDLVLLTKFENIIGMKKKFAQYLEVPISLMGFFYLTFYILR